MIAVIAAGQSLVIITRNIDLSVGSIAGVSAYVTGDVLGNHLGTSRLVAVLIAMAIGLLLGLINGVIVAYGRIPSIIVTLGTLAIYRTWLISFGNARTITADSLPQWLVDLPRSTVFTIGDFQFRTMFVVAIVVVIVLQVFLAGSARAASCTPSAPTRKRRRRPACRCGAPPSRPLRRVGHWPDWAGSCSSPASARSP